MKGIIMEKIVKEILIVLTCAMGVFAIIGISGVAAAILSPTFGWEVAKVGGVISGALLFIILIIWFISAILEE